MESGETKFSSSFARSTYCRIRTDLAQLGPLIGRDLSPWVAPSRTVAHGERLI